MGMQCLGDICGAGVVKGFMGKNQFTTLGGGANSVAHGYTKGSGLGAEIVGTFVLVYSVFSATDAKRSARDSHVPIWAPLPTGFAVFLVHLATIPITRTGINPARSLGAAIIYNKDHAWNDHEEGADITINSLHPGVIATNLSRHSRFMSCNHKFFDLGASTTCYLALNPKAKWVSGEYFADNNVAKPSGKAKDAELAKKLWERGMELTKSK
ncbi:hypothetical protein L1987_02928 [Smallanthus sonchifolius]|uniref:Uncharacterized protein n=1 Tax=Smallanthus sonchifolius TaxID=185202 RepID=A0ACB9K9B3_9ASTR|nr:hypothetical protein L1987_02928 [Smallanthus sonchifolius]